MVESLTAHYSWTKPEVTKSASTWGGFLNNDLDSIDALVFANQQGIVPIGGIQMFGGAAAPANWLLCDGASYVRTAPYDQLFAVLQTRFGAVDGSHFSVPNLVQKYPLGAGAGSFPVGAASGSFNVPIAVGNLPAHAHPITDVAHGHTINQTPHSHTDSGHGHTADQTAHSHNVPNVNLGGGTNIQPGVGFNLVNSVTTDPAQPPVTVHTSNANIQPNSASISLVASGTGLTTTQNTGSGTPLNVVPPFVAVYFIVRFQ